MDHLADPVGAGLDQTGDRRHVVAAGRREHDQGPPPLHDRLVGLAAAPSDDPLELPALLVGEPAHLHWSSHGQILRDRAAQVVEPPRRLVVRALAVAGGIMLWALALSFSHMTVGNPAIPPAQQQQISTELEHDAEIISNSQLQQQISDEPKAVQSEVLAINTRARNISLQLALLVPAIASLLGLANSFRMLRLPDITPSADIEGVGLG